MGRSEGVRGFMGFITVSEAKMTVVASRMRVIRLMMGVAARVTSTNRGVSLVLQRLSLPLTIQAAVGMVG